MGKKKKQENQSAAQDDKKNKQGNQPLPPTHDERKKKKGGATASSSGSATAATGPKSYSLDAGGANADALGPSVLKVQIPTQLEQRLVELIQEEKDQQASQTNISLRLSTKKLTDLYQSLARAGFQHTQITQAMSSTVKYGGGILDALDWLCLNTPNDKLPAGFSTTLTEEEEKKKKPKKRAGFEPPTQAPVPPRPKPAAPKVEKKQKPKVSMKNWILQYAEGEEEEDDLDDLDSDDPDAAAGKKVPDGDPNEQYLDYTSLLLDAKGQATEAKMMEDKAAQKEAMKKIREYTQIMNELEKQPGFNPQIKLTDIDQEKFKEKPQGGAANGRKREVKDDDDDDDDDDDPGIGAGFAMFEEQAAAEPPKPKEKKKKRSELDIREFPYTKQQWTGKSPKQFLIDWVRKHLPKSPPPSYHKKQCSGNLFKTTVTVQKTKDEKLSVCPEILCENAKESEHLGCTLALYHLCKGQRVYQLLPPPYRDVWYEWQDKEDTAKQEKKDEQNKPRDQYISKLMKSLKLEGSTGVEEEKQEQDDEPAGESWEDLADEDEENLVIEKKKSHTPTEKRVSGDQLCSLLCQHQRSAQFQELLRDRLNLPVFQHKEDIISFVRREQVLVVAGETGSGKSTQVPQFILEDCLMNSPDKPCNIICTEPRRISAMSLANRVSQEMGEDGPGSRDALVGYQIRFESKLTESTRLVYCTAGVLLRKLQLDSMLKGVSHVIVDEVHERSVESDFLLLILRHLVAKRSDLKVVLMSATLDSKKFSGYFNHCPVMEIPGRMFPVTPLYLEDIVEQTGYILEDDSNYTLRVDKLVQENHTKLTVSGKAGNMDTLDVSWSKEDLHDLDFTGLNANTYSLQTRNTITRMRQDRINMDLIVEVLSYLEKDPDFSKMTGAVLIFLPGLAHIQELYDKLRSERRFADSKRYQLIALHSVLSSEDQNKAFKVLPPGVRKVVMATNIAETGITIPDVVFVIDAGKVKENRYLEGSQMSRLEEVFISKASAKQRMGRAGRVQEGVCFRLYTQQKFQSLRAYSVPEMLRVPLEELLLLIMKCEFGNPTEFLREALDPPPSLAVDKAMNILKDVGACENDGVTLTPLGHHLAALPVNVRIGKMLLFAAIFGCLDPVCIIAAAMSEKSPFTAPMGKRDQLNQAKQSMAISASDHLTVFKAYQGWENARKQGYQAENKYCNKLFLKRTNLLEIENVSRDLRKLVHSIGFGPKGASSVYNRDFSTTYDYSLSKRNCAIIKSVITAGLYPNVALSVYAPPVDKDANPEKKVCLVQTGQGPAQVHPSSVNSHLAATGWFVFHEKVKHGKVFVRDASLISPYPILLFGGDIAVQHTKQLVSVDGWIKFKAYAQTGVIFKELRIILDELLRNKLNNPKFNIEGEPMVQLLLELIQSEK